MQRVQRWIGRWGGWSWCVVPGLAACGEQRDADDSATTITVTDASASATDGTDTGVADSSGGTNKLDIGVGTNATEGDVDGTDDCQQDIDIVFVMDVSTSMGPILSTLADDILVVDETIAALGLPNPPHYGLVVFVDDAVILNSGTPYPDVETLRADFMQWSSFTSTNQQVGGGNDNSTWPENSLDALYIASAGFQWRAAGDDTLRMIIHTTDDTFWDGPTDANGVAIAHGYDEVVDALQQGSIRTFSFASQIGGSCECEDVTPGWSMLAGQLSLSAAINGAIDETMCQPYTPVG